MAYQELLGHISEPRMASLPAEIKCYLFNLKENKRFGRDNSQPELLVDD